MAKLEAWRLAHVGLSVKTECQDCCEDQWIDTEIRSTSISCALPGAWALGDGLDYSGPAAYIYVPRPDTASPWQGSLWTCLVDCVSNALVWAGWDCVSGDSSGQPQPQPKGQDGSACSADTGDRSPDQGADMLLRAGSSSARPVQKRSVSLKEE